MESIVLKKTIFIFSFLPIILFAQPEQSNFVKIGLIAPFTFTADVSYEGSIPNSYLTYQINLSRTTINGVLDEEAVAPKLSGYSGELQMRKYFDKLMGLEFFYCGGSIEYSKYQFAIDTFGDRITLLDGNGKLISVIFGLHLEVASNFFLDFTIGGSYHFANYNVFSENIPTILNQLLSQGVLPKLNFKASYGF
jgi:hypothetical protein